jgi:hypothetical protein
MKTIIAILFILVTVGSVGAETCYDKYTMHPVPCNDKPARTCWEYLTEYDGVLLPNGSSYSVVDLKKNGLKGWELVSIEKRGSMFQGTQYNGFTVFYFKRPIKCGGAE